MSKTPSRYLTEKVETFNRTLRFFLDNSMGSRHSVRKKRLVFLSQIDFWDWELDSIIFSFDNFEERSKSWDYICPEKLAKLGLLVKPSVLERKLVHWSQCGTNQVVAPHEDLDELIDMWNDLLTRCEDTVLSPDSGEMSAINPQWLPNLDKFRKSRRPHL